MKIILTTLAVSLTLPLINARAISPDDEFQTIAKDYVEGFLQSHPESATELGEHRFDDVLTDYSIDGRFRELRRAKQVREQLDKFKDPSQLTGANQVDVRLLKDNIDNEIFEL